MTEDKKKALKVVALIGGIALVGVGGYFLFKHLSSGSEEEQDENKYLSKPSQGGSSGGSGGSYNQPYPKEEVKNMQAWLLTSSIFYGNGYVAEQIKNTGGLDGVMGTGFYNAMQAAIKEGWVSDLKDLHNKSNKT